MKNYLKGMTAGLIATLVLSALMVMKTMMGVMPGFDLPAMIAGMMGMPGTPIVGWVAHFMIGIVLYGVAIVLSPPLLPGVSPIARGLIVGLSGWLVMMVMLMPMAGAGMFGMHFGIMAPMMTLVLHLIFGAVLGWYYGQAVRTKFSLGSART